MTELLLPADHRIVTEIKPDAKVEVTQAMAVPDGWIGVDIGPRTELLFADIAQAAARTIAEAGKNKFTGRLEKNKPSQLRKFYDELVMWHDKLAFEKTADARAAKYRELAPFIKMMNAKVAYAKGRGHVDQNFEQLFSHLISQIACPATLAGQ